MIHCVRSVPVLLSAGLVFLFAGCHREIRPQAIHPEDNCAYCRMAISQLNFACEIVAPDGTVLKFDDVGCMVKYTEERIVPKGSVPFIRDFYSGEWAEAGNAVYVKSPAVMTPMNFGVVALSRQENLRRFLSEYGGAQQSYGQLKEAVEVR